MSSTYQKASDKAEKASMEGERLEREIWADMKASNHKELAKKIADDFQSIHLDGPRNREQELDLIKHLKLGSYTLNNFKAIEHGDIITITYMVSADENIDDRHLPGKSSPRMSVWKRNKDHQWQWIAHANLRSLGKGRE